MSIHPAAFYVFGSLAIAFALLTVLKKNPVSSAFSLVMTFFAFAGMYASMNAHLIAALQVLVYAGAIMVLFIFVIMLLNADEPSLDMGRTPAWMKAGAAIMGLALLAVLVISFQHAGAPEKTGAFTTEAIDAAGGNTRVIAQLMFSKYLLPVELTSILLLTAIVAAVTTAKRKLGRTQS